MSGGESKANWNPEQARKALQAVGAERVQEYAGDLVEGYWHAGEMLVKASWLRGRGNQWAVRCEQGRHGLDCFGDGTTLEGALVALMEGIDRKHERLKTLTIDALARALMAGEASA